MVSKTAEADTGNELHTVPASKQIRPVIRCAIFLPFNSRGPPPQKKSPLQKKKLVAVNLHKLAKVADKRPKIFLHSFR
jgi:hypothetical protein